MGAPVTLRMREDTVCSGELLAVDADQTRLHVARLATPMGTYPHATVRSGDVLCLEPPRALYAERSMYATPALLGAACYVLLHELMANAQLRGRRPADWLVVSIPFLLALLLRAAAWTYRLALPRWARKTVSFGSFLRGETTESVPVDYQQKLGYLWTLPEDTSDSRGLGGGIAWAWDPNLCDNIIDQFSEDFFFIPFITCVAAPASRVAAACRAPVRRWRRNAHSLTDAACGVARSFGSGRRDFSNDRDVAGGRFEELDSK